MSDAASRVGIIVHFLRCHTNPIWRSTLLKAFFASSTYTVQQQRSRLAKPLVLDSFLGPETMEKNNREVKPRFGLLQNIESKHGIVLKYVEIVSSCFFCIKGWALNGARNSKVLAQLCDTICGMGQLNFFTWKRTAYAKSKLSQAWIHGSQTKRPSQACSLQPRISFSVFRHTHWLSHRSFAPRPPRKVPVALAWKLHAIAVSGDRGINGMCNLCSSLSAASECCYLYISHS